MVGKLLSPVIMRGYFLSKGSHKIQLRQLYNPLFRHSRIPACPTSKLQFLQRGTQFELSRLEINQEAIYFRPL